MVASRSLEYRFVPPPESGRPVLVFLHEGLGSLALWRDLPAAIADRAHCGYLVYSRYGNGFSQPLDGSRDVRYMHDEALVVLPELLEMCGITAPLLVGHSDGASIALIYAGSYPQHVAGVVVEAPHLFVERCSVESIAAIGELYRAGTLRERMARHHEDVDRTFWGWNDIWLDPAFASWNIESYVPQIAAPVFAIQGTSDEYGTLAQLDALAARVTTPVDRLVLSRCGHAPHRDRRLIVEHAICGWIADVLP